MRIQSLFWVFGSVLLLFFTKPVLGQLNTPLEENISFRDREDSLNKWAGKMFSDPLPNDRMNSGLNFAKILYKTLQEPGSFEYSFDSLGRQIHVLYSEDKSLRIFNWLVRLDNFMVRYYGIIQTKDSVFPLINRSDQLMFSKTFLVDSLDTHHWFGASYYKILTKKESGTRYYFLFGLNRDGSYSNKKILDVLYFVDDRPVFGAPLFDVPSENGEMQTQSRMLWQYQKGAVFSLDFDQKRKIIAFDQLHSRINNPLKKNTYVPTGQVDALSWKNGQWVYMSNILKVLKLKDGQAPINGVIQKANK